MEKNKSILKKSLTNSAILYVISRYVTYFIQFVNSLFISVYLGPYYLGIWGFINLVLNYINQLNFGISHSVNVIISVEKEKKEYVQKVIGNGLTMVILLSTLIFLFFAISSESTYSIGEKYNFNKYIIPVFIIAVFTHFNNILSNVFRVYGKVLEIALNQSLYTIIIIFIIPFFRGQSLLSAMVIANLVSVVISLILYLFKTPIKLKILFNIELIKQIQKKGWFLFIFNSAFALILITTQSFISSKYSVNDFGYFTFSYSLANAILLFLNAMSYLIFPKLINRFANGENNHTQKILASVRTAYISTSHILIHFLIMMFPLLLLIFPDYKGASDVFKVIALTVALYTNSYGYQTVLIARNNEKLAAIISFSALILNIIFVPLFVYILNVQFSYVMFATMLVYFLYVLLSGVAGRKELKLSISIKDTLSDIFPVRMFIPFIISILLILLPTRDIYFIIPFVLYLLLNTKDLKEIKALVIKLIKNPDFINI